MSSTLVRKSQIRPLNIIRSDINTTTSGSALITKIIAGTGLTLSSSTGVNPGTGDVTVALSIATASTLGGVKIGSGLTIAVDGTISVTSASTTWGSITGLLSNQSDLWAALNAKYNNPTGTTLQYIDGTGALQDFPLSLPTEFVRHQVKAGVPINKGQAVYVRSSDGTNMIVELASYDAELTSSKTMGLIDRTLAPNDFGNVVTEGLLAGLDTTAAQAGDPVWLGPNGDLLYGIANKPHAPFHMVFLGIVTRVNANNGEIFVKVQNGYEIDELHDVLISSPATGQLLRRDSDGLWKNWTPNYLTSFTETDPTVPAHVKAITTTNISNWNTAYSWGNHAGLYSLLGHTHTFASLTSIPTTLAGYGITDAATSAQGAKADTAFSWGNHASYGYATQTYVNTAISNLVDTAPATLDTLNELAAALGDDPNFATTVTNNIATKVSKSGDTMTGNLNWAQTDRGITWGMNTDGAYIKFYNTGDGDTNSRLEYATSDNGDEYHRWMISSVERMTLRNEGLNVNGVVYSNGYGNSTQWIAAYNWGNHASAGYLTSFTETDPTVPAHVKAITATNISNWNTAYGWGNHATVGYLTSVTNISGNAGTATVLQTARTINGTSFNGSANIETSYWGATRTITIGNTGKTLNGSGNQSWSLAEIGAQPAGSYAAASHTHDDRYLPYTRTSDVNKAAGWYTIAVNSGNRAVGKFILRDTSSGNHQAVVFYATHHFGSYSDISVLINSRYSGNPFRYLRIVDGGTYDGALLQVYIDDSSCQVQAWMLENIHANGWIIKDWVADGVNPGDVPNFAAMTTVPAQIDLDLAAQGGMIVTGPIYGGGDTTQYEYLNTNNYASITDARYYTESESDARFAAIAHTHDLMRYSLRAPGNVDSLTSSNFRDQLFGTSSNGWTISTARWNSVPSGLSGMNMYGTMFAWSGSDTHGFIATDYSTANIQVGGGSGNSITWKATLIHSSNIGSYALTSLPAHTHDDRYYTESESDSRYLYYRGVNAETDFQRFQDGVGEVRFDQINDYNNLSNAPGGYNYGGVLSMRGDNFGFQIWGSHTGDLYYKTQWSGDNYTGWRSIITSINIGSQSVSYATTAGSANSVAWTNVSGRPTTVSSFTNDSGYITSASLSSYVPTSRTITINGVGYDLSANRSWTISATDNTKLPLAGGTMSGTIVLKSISGVEQTVPNEFGAYLHLGDWGIGRTDPRAVLVNTAYRADYADSLFDMNISRFTNNSGYITSSALSSYLPLSGGTLTGTVTVNGGSSFVSGGYNNSGGFAMNNASTYWGLMWNYASNDWRLGRGSQTAQNGWNLRWDASDNVYTNGTLNANYFRNGSVWMNNGADYNGYNENIRLFAAPNGVSVIAFNASGLSGTPSGGAILGYSDRLEFRKGGDAWQFRIHEGYTTTAGTAYAYGYRGNGNVGGTGEASWHPAGIYSGSTQWLYGTTYRNSASTYGQGQIYFDSNYGYGLVGLYSSTRYQAIFAMGDAYKLPVDGTSTGSLYGLAWSHPNAGGVAGNLNTHGLLVMENGTFLAAISGSIRARDDVRAPALYDSGSRVAISRGEGRNYVDYSRYVYNNGAYSGSGWVEPSDLGVRYAASANYATSAGSASSASNATRADMLNGYGAAYGDTHPGHGLRVWYDWAYSGTYRNGITIGSHPSDTYYGWQIFQNMWDDRTYTRRYNGGFQSTRTLMNHQDDPYPANMNQYVRTSDSVTFGEVYTGGWFRNNNNRTGLYNQANGNHIYSRGGSEWVVTGNGGNIELQFWSNHESGRRGYVYADTSNNIGFLNSGGSWSLRCDNSGNVTATGDVTAYSDARIKTNINTIENALEKVLQLRGVSYVRTDNDDKALKLGLIAQEVQEVLPEVVSIQDNGLLTVSYGNIVGALVEAIKEQQKEIEILKSKLN
jgi:hypothetical protein